MDGFYLYINGILETFIHSNIIPRPNEMLEYNDKLYFIKTIKYCISKDKIIGDATINYKVKSCIVYVI